MHGRGGVANAVAVPILASLGLPHDTTETCSGAQTPDVTVMVKIRAGVGIGDAAHVMIVRRQCQHSNGGSDIKIFEKCFNCV